MRRPDGLMCEHTQSTPRPLGLLPLLPSSVEIYKKQSLKDKNLSVLLFLCLCHSWRKNEREICRRPTDQREVICHEFYF